MGKKLCRVCIEEGPDFQEKEKDLVFFNRDSLDRTATRSKIIESFHRKFTADKFYFKEQDTIQRIKENYYANVIIKCFKNYIQRKKSNLRASSEEKYLMMTKKNILLNCDKDYIILNLSPEEEYIYIGNTVNNSKEGFGIQIFGNNQKKFIGNFKNNKKIGWCIFFDFFSEYVYKGEIENYIEGQYGLYYNKKYNISYEGEWLDNHKEGYGIEIYQKKNKYSGFFSSGQKEGIGVFHWNNDSTYEGEWANNCMNGFGIYKSSSGKLYSGSWKKNSMDGFGIYGIPKYRIYAGYFKENKKNGFGIIFWYKECKSLVSFWNEGKQNGVGKYMSKDKTKYGFWIDGNKIIKLNSYMELADNFSENQKKYLNFFKLEYEEIKSLIEKWDIDF